MAENLVITIGADASKIEAELQIATNKIKQLERELRRTQDVDVAANLKMQLQEVRTQASTLQGTMAHLNNTMRRQLAPGTSQAGVAMADLNRVIQDAPYGFMAISNNLNPLLESMTRLKQNAGSTGSAMSLLGQTLMGPAGIGVALSLASTAIILFQRYAQRAKEEMSDSEKEAKKFADSLHEAKKSALATGMQLQAYVDIARNGQLPLEQRNEALKQANEIMGEHGEKLTLVNINTAKATEQINLMSKALISQAVASKYTDRAADLTIQLEEAKRDLVAANTAVSLSENELNATLSRNKIILGSAARMDAQAEVQSYKEAKAINAKNAAIKKETEAKSRVKTLNSQLIQIQNSLNASTLEATKLYGQLGEKPKEKKERKKKIKDIETIAERYTKYLDTVSDIGREEELIGRSLLVDRVKNALDMATSMIKDFNVSKDNKYVVKVFADYERLFADLEFKRLQDELNKRKLNIQVGIDDKFLQDFRPIISNSYRQATKFLSKENKDLQKEMQANADAINGIIKNTFEGVAESVANGFAALMMGGNIGDFFKGVFGTIADGMIQLGKQFIQMAIQISIVKKFLIKNPALAIAGGVALVAIGSVLKSLMSKKTAFATGTTFAPGGLALVGERGPELIGLPRGSQVIPATQTSRMMGAMESVQVYGVLRGQDIYFSNKKYGQTYNRTA